jgi:hypothetical protein
LLGFSKIWPRAIKLPMTSRSHLTQSPSKVRFTWSYKMSSLSGFPTWTFSIWSIFRGQTQLEGKIHNNNIVRTILGRNFDPRPFDKVALLMITTAQSWLQCKSRLPSSSFNFRNAIKRWKPWVCSQVIYKRLLSISLRISYQSPLIQCSYWLELLSTQWHPKMSLCNRHNLSNRANHSSQK